MSANRACSEKSIQRHDAVLSSGEIIMMLSNSRTWPSAGKSLVDGVPRYGPLFHHEALLYLVMARILTYILKVQRNDAASFEPEIICTASWGFGVQKTRGKGIEDVL